MTLNNKAIADEAVPVSRPTITVSLQPMPAGPNGEYYFTPNVTIRDMPGGWRMAHHGLCLAIETVVEHLLREAEPQRRILRPQQVRIVSE